MTEDQKQSNQQDRQNDTGNQANEVQRIAKKMGLSEKAVQDAFQQVGNIPEKVEAYLTDKGDFKEQPSTW